MYPPSPGPVIGKNVCTEVPGDSPLDMNRQEKNYFIFRQGRVLVHKGAPDIRPMGEEWHNLEPSAEIILPLSKGIENTDFVVELSPEADPDLEWVSLRSLVGRVNDDSFNLWGKAAQILNWQKTHRYCGSCGRKTADHPSEQAKICPVCSLSWYPRIAPCIIVLVTRGEEMLLARSPRFTEGMYSTLAGFVEPGESVESTLQREIAEEVAIGIKNIRYFGSQPWPFPGQLMLGFLAEYDTGEIHIDGIEISDAGWYTSRNLPQIPGEGTIAGQMIRHYLSGLDRKSL
jgi:NAD+ diphosphatase